MALSFKLTSTDFRGVVNRRFWANFLPFPATNQFYFDVGTPNFKLPDVTHDREVELRDYREKTPIILAFTRIFTAKQYCPFCFPHLVELGDRYEEFRALGFEVLLVTSTDRAQSQQVAKDLGLKMPLLSDPACNIFRAYGVGQALGAPLPAQFLLDREGKLRYRHLFSFIEPNAPIDRLIELAQPWSPVQTPAVSDQPNAPTQTNQATQATQATEMPEMLEKVDDRGAIESIARNQTNERESRLDDSEIVVPELEPMPDTSQAIAFAAKSTQAIDDRPLEMIEPELEPLPNSTAIAPIKRRQPWLDDATDATAIEGEIVRDRRPSPPPNRRSRP